MRRPHRVYISLMFVDTQLEKLWIAHNFSQISLGNVWFLHCLTLTYNFQLKLLTFKNNTIRVSPQLERAGFWRVAQYTTARLCSLSIQAKNA